MIRDLFISYSRIYFLPGEREFLAQGLVFGDDSKLSTEMKKLFQQLGLSHFTAASGANLRLFLPDWLRELPIFRWASFWALCELLGVNVYLHLASFSPSLWRAFIFWLIGWLGRWLGRKVPVVVSSAWVLVVTIFTHKEYFGFLGFQLSFLCMIALWFSQAISKHEKLLQESLKKKYFVWIREMFRDSLCIFLFLTPLLYFRFKEILPIGVVGTMAATIPLQFFTQLSLFAMVVPQFFFVERLRQMLYAIIAGIFFCLWFVHLSVLYLFVWLGIFVSIGLLLLQVHRGRSLWRTVQ